MSLNIETPGMLEEYLREKQHIYAGEIAAIKRLEGGVSNRTVWVQRQDGESWVVKQALEKLRVAVDWFSSPARIHREALGLREVAQLLPNGATPAFLFEDWENHLLAMSAIPHPHQNWKTMLLQGELQVDHIQQFAKMLGQIHRVSADKSQTLAEQFADRSFFEALRLEPYYAYTATQVPAATQFFEHLIAETRRRRYCVVHGDYSPKNVLIHREQLVLLDYEVIHWGDPAFDLGFSLTHLLSKAHHLSHIRQEFMAASILYWESYQEVVGDHSWTANLEQWAVRHTLACLLARVAGRSPLEYLSEEERQRQQAVVVTLLTDVPLTVKLLAEQFMAAL